MTSVHANDTVLFGPLSLDRYGDTVRPGGGVLNIAYHLRRLALPCTVISRLGDDAADLFGAFLRRHGIAHLDSLVVPGTSSSIDVTFDAGNEPHMHHFVEGVWAGVRLTPAEDACIGRSRRLHVVMVDGAGDEVDRLGGAGVLGALTVSADFLSMRRYPIERFTRAMRHVDIGFIGWPGEADDPALDQIARVAFDLGRLVVITMGSRRIRVLDGRDGPTDTIVPVDALAVTGTTIGCGDAFAAGFLASWAGSPDVPTVIDHAKALGAAATAWWAPLPDDAYDDPV